LVWTVPSPYLITQPTDSSFPIPGRTSLHSQLLPGCVNAVLPVPSRRTRSPNVLAQLPTWVRCRLIPLQTPVDEISSRDVRKANRTLFVAAVLLSFYPLHVSFVSPSCKLSSTSDRSGIGCFFFFCARMEIRRLRRFVVWISGTVLGSGFSHFPPSRYSAFADHPAGKRGASPYSLAHKAILTSPSKAVGRRPVFPRFPSRLR